MADIWIAAVGWSYQGCFTDSNDRVLAGASRDHPNMTLQACGAWCDDEAYSFFGVEYGTQCYCGYQISGSPASSTDCTMPCGGEDSQTCGGGWAIDVSRPPFSLTLIQTQAETHAKTFMPY